MAGTLNWSNVDWRNAPGDITTQLSPAALNGLKAYLGGLGWDQFRDANWSNPAYQSASTAAMDAGLRADPVMTTDEAKLFRDFWDQKLNGYGYQEARDGSMLYGRIVDQNGNPVAADQYDTNDTGLFEQAVPLIIGGIATAGLSSALGGLGAAEGAAAGSLTGPGALDAYAAMDAAYGGAGLGAAGGAGTIVGGGGLAGSLGGGMTAGEAAGLAGGSGMTGGLGGAAGSAGTSSGIGNVLAKIGSGVSGNGLSSLIGTGLSTVGNLYAQSQAADALKGATAESSALLKYMYDTTRADNMPALTARNNALGDLQALLKNPSSITSDPSYAFGMNEGTRALNSGAAARGMTYSGAQQKALTKFGQDFASTKLGDSFQRLATVAGLGQSGAGTIASAGANYANGAGSNTTTLGSALGSNALLTGQTIGNAINGLTAYGQRNGWWGG